MNTQPNHKQVVRPRRAAGCESRCRRRTGRATASATSRRHVARESSEDSPTYIFGDASGGADTRDAALRRVGLAVAVFSDLTSDMMIEIGIWGGLPGAVQTVARGELHALYLTVRGGCVHV
eukprot:2353033-Pyramimonas_sp.AAC.1